MSLLACTGKLKKKIQKFAIVEVFRARIPSSTEPVQQIKQIDKFANELAKPHVSIQKIKSLAWYGIPNCIRPKIWKYLLRYGPINGGEELLNKKRLEYKRMITNYGKMQTLNEHEIKIMHTIQGDVKRIGSQLKAIFKEAQIQSMLKRLLFIWHVRHPASGYVQGMCDITNPFVIVFLSEYLPFDYQQLKFSSSIQILDEELLLTIEADIYWCMSKMMESVVFNYTQGFGGMHQAYSKVENLLYKIDQQLYQHFVKQKIDLFTLSFRNISTMLLRSFSPLVGIRLFDTYIAYEQQYPTLMLFLMIALLQKFAQKMLSLKFDELMGFVQNLPTKSWQQSDLEVLIAEAFVLKQIFTEKKK